MKKNSPKILDLYRSEKFFVKNLKKKNSKHYWSSKKDPDGVERDRIRNFSLEKKIFLRNNKLLIKTIRNFKFRSLCDVGCGPGFLLSAFKGKKLFGIENDKDAIKKAKNFGTIYNFDLNKKNILKNKFDIVVCYHVIEHVKNPQRLINFLKNILKKNGKLIIGTPDFDSAMARKFGDRYRMLHDKTHISLFSFDSLLRFLRKNNLKVINVDFPYFETSYFTKKNILKVFNKNKISPPFYGNFITVTAEKK